jgi:hypothetical protein
MYYIKPYKVNGQWVFDDDSRGLVREALVLGIDTILDLLTKDIPNRDAGVPIIFSAEPFPQYTAELIWEREELGGNWYFCPQVQLSGWLCPALLCYFEEAPEKIFVKLG